MAEIFHYIGISIVLLFLFVGVLHCMKGLVWLFIRPLKNSRIILELFLDEREENTEFALREAVCRIKWFKGEIAESKIVCIDNGMTAESRRICDIYREKYPGLVIEEIKEGEGPCRMF